MIDVEQVRGLALALPEAVEQDHHGVPSFRVCGKIFATLPDPQHLNVMLDVDGIVALAQLEAAVCSEVYWGKRLAALQVDLRRAQAELVRRLLADAWRHKAPKRLQLPQA